MKRKSLLRNSIALALVTFGAGSLVGCKKKTDEGEKVYYSFSIGVKSGASIIQFGAGASTEYISVYDNGIDTAGRSYSFASTDTSVATIDQDGKITPLKAGKVNFVVTENKSGDKVALKKDLQVVPYSAAANGGFNYSGGTTEPELEKRAEILGKLEKYAMDTKLTGITLFDNGGYVKYSSRVRLPIQEYIVGYGFGLLSEGELDGTLPGTDGGTTKPTYLHSSIAQDSLKINQYTASGSQVSDLASYITSSYWSTKLDGQTSYKWFPCLASDEIYPTSVDAEGNVVIDTAATKVENGAPIAMEPANSTKLYKKWRVYVKTYDATKNPGMVFHTNSDTLKAQGFNGRHVTIDDYLYVYKLLLTGSNNIIRGTEMANDTSYGIKGAQRYFNATKSAKTSEEIDAQWTEFLKKNDKGESKLGLGTGSDANGDYIDIELVNPIDAFTAMYTLSSSLTSPLPKELFEGSKAIVPGSMKDSIQTYGTFNNKGDNAILDYTICLGAFTLEKWTKNSEIMFSRNDDWFEHSRQNRYHIPGIYYRVIDVSTDTEKNWKQLEAGNLDSAGVPAKKVEANKGKPGVKQTKGDSTFKLNVNSCTQEEWNELFGPQGKWPADGTWEIKPWMSNQDFLDGLFYSIDRKSFADKRGVTPSVNYFSDAYLWDPVHGKSYNESQAHKNDVAGFETINKAGESDYGYNYDKAVNCFRNAVSQLSAQGKITLGQSKANPTTIKIHIRWMYQTDIKEYGEDIKSYFETAFNDDAVCGGRVKLQVEQDAVTNWEDVYNVWMMQGRFDLGFGAISGNTYNPLDFMEVLKSDNSSSFTLNWGQDTSKVDEKNPIIYDGRKWSFDALWEVADHGGIVRTGEKEDAIKSCTYKRARTIDGSKLENDLYKGFQVTIPVEFAEFDESAGEVHFGIDRVDLYVYGAGNVTLGENGDANLVYDPVNKKVVVTVSEEKAQEINQLIKTTHGYKDDDKDEWHKNPFISAQLDQLFSYELYYTIQIGAEGSASVNYSPVTAGDE